MRRHTLNKTPITLLVPLSRNRAVEEQLLVNGTFDSTLTGWISNGQVKPVDGRAELALSGSLSQEVELPEGTRQVQLKFDISHWYGAGQVRLSNGPSLRIAEPGHYEPIVDVPDELTSVLLHFSASPGSFHLDNVVMKLLADNCEPVNLVENPDFPSSMDGWITSNVTWAGEKARSGAYGTLKQNLGRIKPGSVGTIEFEISSAWGSGGTVSLEGIVTSSFTGVGIKQGSFAIPDDYEEDVILRFDLSACDIDNIRVVGCGMTDPAGRRSGGRTRCRCGCDG